VTVDGRLVCCRTLPATSPLDGVPSLTLPILLLHGLGCSGDAWGPALTLLHERRLGQPVYAPDLPGYGHSPGPQKALGMPELADWAASLLDRLGVAQAHLAGNSMGCQVALELARRHPDRVGGVVLVGPTTGAGRVPYWRYAIGLLLDGFWEPLRYNATLNRMYAQMGPRRYFATVRRMREDEPLDYAGEITAPCLVLRGQHDGIVPDTVARELTAKLPRSRFVRVPDAAHALQFNRPEQFVDRAVTFWSEAQ
jgi:pimeloyl-ACP methyl ester carboxylesterase